MRKVIDFLRPAFDEMWIYGMSLFGVLASPFVLAGATGAKLQLGVDQLVMAGVIAVLVTGYFELKGSPEAKKKPAVMKRRYFLAFAIGLIGQNGVQLLVKGIEKVTGLV